MHRIKIIFAFLFFITSSTVRAEGNGLVSLLKKAEENNLSLQAARQEINAAGFELSAENTLEPTSVEYSPFFRNGASGVASSELVVSQEFDFPTLYAARGKAAKLQVATLEAGYASLRRDILLSVNQTYLDIIGLKKERDVLDERVAVADTLLSLFQRRLELGFATALEVNRIRMEQMDLRSEILRNESEYGNAMASLELLCGAIPGSLEITDREYPLALPSLKDSFQATDLIMNDTGILAAQSALEASGQEVKVARQGWIPKLSAGYRRNTELDEASNGFLVGASFPLFSTSRKVKAATARQAAAQINLEDARLKAVSEMEANIKEYSRLLESLKIIDLNLINETLALMRKSVDSGNMTATDFYMESDNLYQKIGNYLTIENSLQKTLATLRRNTL